MSEATTRTVHMCMCIDGMLRWPDKDLKGLLVDDKGNPQLPRVVRDWLKIEKLKGRRVIPFGKACEGFSYETGCPGHPVTDESKERGQE
jgi:hypothetical protein